MTEDRFFERLRADAAVLRHEPDPGTLARIRAGIRDRIDGSTIDASATVAGLLAAWLRPLAAALAVVIAVAIGAAALIPADETALDESPVVVSMAGEPYLVSN
jgi:hypothetical protein